MLIVAGARSSPLSGAQIEEVLEEIRSFFPAVEFEMVWTITQGDKDKKTSLRHLEKTDFFTRELDQMLLAGEIEIAIHSAKDLPDPIPSGLVIGALTKGRDPRDTLVLREGEALREGARIGTSSIRREEAVSRLCPNLQFFDLRGNIGERLEKLRNGEADGIIVAEAAIQRLKLTHLNRIFLPGETAPLQGRLAVVMREQSHSLRELFHAIHFVSRT